MTEQEWLVSNDPAAMLGWLRVMPGLSIGTPSDRKKKLWVEACRASGSIDLDRYVGSLDDPQHLQQALQYWSASGTDPLPFATRVALLRDIAGNPFVRIKVIDSRKKLEQST